MFSHSVDSLYPARAKTRHRTLSKRRSASASAAGPTFKPALLASPNALLRLEMREGLVQARTQLVNSVRGWLRAQGHRVRSGTTSSFPSRVRSHFAEDSLELPGCVERQLRMVEQLSTSIEEASHEIDVTAKQDETCRRLMTVPGVGPVTATRSVAAIDQVSRFPDAHKLESYLGLVPGENSSSEKQRRTGITKAGPSALRWALVQTAWSAQRCKRKDPIHAWADEVERRRGKHVAVLALARKIAGILSHYGAMVTPTDRNLGPSQSPHLSNNYSPATGPGGTKENDSELTHSRGEHFPEKRGTAVRRWRSRRWP